MCSLQMPLVGQTAASLSRLGDKQLNLYAVCPNKRAKLRFQVLFSVSRELRLLNGNASAQFNEDLRATA